MPSTVKNNAIVKKHKEIVEMVYCEPDGKEALDSFLHHGDEIVANAGNNSKKKEETLCWKWGWKGQSKQH